MKKVLKLFLVLVLMCGLIVPSFATIEESKQKAKDIQESINQKKEEVEKNKKEEGEVRESLEIVLGKKQDLETRIAKTEESIEAAQKELDRLVIEIDKAKQRIEKRKDEYGQRISAMYVHESDSFIEIVLKSKSVSDFLNRLDYMKAINEQDEYALMQLKQEHEKFNALKDEQKEKFDALEALQAKQKVDKEKLAAVEVELAARAEELKNQRAELEKEIETKQADLANIEADILAKQEAAAAEARQREQERFDSQEAERKRQEAEAKAALAAEARRKAEESGSEEDAEEAAAAEEEANRLAEEADEISRGTTSRGYIWPVPASSYVSSPFGSRNHPILGQIIDHNGMDIAAPAGSDILAVQAGVVTKASWYGGYGNCVIITHADGMSTLYGHASAIYVSEGQYVEQGDVIAAVGTTGMSTGNHLHIGFMTSGGYWTDPANYLY